jgi:hypothetical protein
MNATNVKKSEIDQYKKTEYLRRALLHVKAYAVEHYPQKDKYKKVKSKVRGNLKSQVKARHNKSHAL